MREFKILGLFGLMVATTFCGNKKNENSTKEDTSKIPVSALDMDVSEIPLEDCIKKAIYYINEVDITTYDSISTQYFHQVIDYKDSTALEIDAELAKLTYILEVDGSQFYDNQQMDSIISRVGFLKKELVNYNKEVIGYVFVHTFLNKSDTLSAIILANAEGTKSEAIKIKTITDIEPEYFKQKIRNIDQ